MASEDVLRKTLKNADGKPFIKYKGLQNNFVLEDFELIIDDVQNDRTGHTAMRVRVPMKNAGFPEDTFGTKEREVALRDLIARRFWESARTHARSPIQKTDGGELYIPRPGQEILERWSVVITKYYVEVRFTADLPSVGGKASATAMELLIFQRIRTVVQESMYYKQYKQSKLYNHLFTYENAEAIRASLEGKGLVAFIAEGSILPRRDDDLAPMVDAVPFACDADSKVTMEVPNGEPISGLGIRSGMTAVVGASGSGRSTLIDSVVAGVYDHIPGDGREYVITREDAAFIISEPGRASDSVDVSMFMDGVTDLQSASLSAPESELVSISEAVEMGAGLIVMDEEFSSQSVIRKGFMAEGERITPVSELGRSMATSGISVLMVTGDESAVRRADYVISMIGFKASATKVDPIVADAEFRRPCQRYPVSKNMVFEKGRKDVSVSAQSVRAVEIGEFTVNVPIAAIYDMSQTRTVADAVVVAKDLMDGTSSIRDVCEKAISSMVESDSSDAGTGMHHSRIRAIDLAAVLNRHPQMLAIQKR